ncbi:unnamed protein product [Rotaria socialis]|uniref:Uncharacterized protein n=1 Tax=Rotaria socialis TaxID=392032 RepID=A0A817U8S9_9BILA|nr:unnamed protein product [Rotaria socialis]
MSYFHQASTCKRRYRNCSTRSISIDRRKPIFVSTRIDLVNEHLNEYQRDPIGSVGGLVDLGTMLTEIKQQQSDSNETMNKLYELQIDMNKNTNKVYEEQINMNKNQNKFLEQ